ncbi:MAG: histidine kinase [Bacteroidales bacterium]|nr:histidine kinase [Bacteroidales bacterium]
MILHIALILAFAFQLAAAVIAVQLVRETKYNAAWFLLASGLLCAAALRFWDILSRVLYEERVFSEAYVWLGVLSSFCFAVGVFFVRKILFHIRDIEEERRHLEKKFRTAIIQTEEKERMHFAKEIHDGIGPLLSTAKLSVGALYNLFPNYTENHGEDTALHRDSHRTPPPSEGLGGAMIKNIESILNEALKSAKEISNNLTPHVLTNFGLEKAIHNFINKIDRNYLLQISFTSNIQNLRFNPNLEISLYRIVCELINNTIKHASASRAMLDIRMSHHEIRMVYTDDGSGFDAKKIFEESSGIGFSSIFSRIDSFKGKIDIQSAHNEGVVIVITIPIEKL